MAVSFKGLGLWVWLHLSWAKCVWAPEWYLLQGWAWTKTTSFRGPCVRAPGCSMGLAKSGLGQVNLGTNVILVKHKPSLSCEWGVR